MECEIEDSDNDNPSDADGHGGVGNDGDCDGDDQYSVEEVYAELNKPEPEYSVGPKYKSVPAQPSSTKKSPPPSSTTGRTILNFFKSAPKTAKHIDSPMPANASTPESQEKRPSSMLLSSLDNDYNRKCPKIERESVSTAAQDSAEMENQEVDLTTLPTPPQEEQDLENEQMESSKKKKRADRNSSTNPLATPIYESTPMDQDVVEVNSENPGSGHIDLNATRWEDSSDMFDESMEMPKTPEPKESPNTKNSPTPSKVNDRPRGYPLQFKYEERRSTEQSSPSSSTVHSEPSSEGILTQQSATEPNSNNDQGNSDLNTEADQLKALNVTSDK